MQRDFTDRIREWDGIGVVVHHDQPTGTWMFVCLHDNSLGNCAGGTRMKVYGSLSDAVEDGMRLARGMTHKWAIIRQPYGGGKAVLAVPHPMEGEERTGLLRRYGSLIESLRGGFLTGEDLGTNSADMEVIAERTRSIHGFDSGEKINPSPYTARGVLRGIQAALESVYGSPSVEGRSVLIQGTGNVGEPLGEELTAGGARVLVSDIDPDRAEAAASRFGGEVVDPEGVYSTPCDVYAPCAVGATLNSQTIPALRCRIVAGSANNQLASEEDAERLVERGVLYIPDYIINAGGALSFSVMLQGVPPGDQLMERMDIIGDTVSAVVGEASAARESPVEAARRRVEETLSEARATG